MKDLITAIIAAKAAGSGTGSGVGVKGDKGDPGPQGPQGEKGDKGDTGPAGSDANVTSATIAAALGYTPASSSDIPSALKNPEVLTFTGGASGSYDGSKALSIHIPMPTMDPPTYASSVSWLEENGDKSKLYVLPDGFLYSCQSSATVPKFTNLFDPGTAILNQQLATSDGSQSVRDGSFITSKIAVDPTDSTTAPQILRIKGAVPTTAVGYDNNIIVYYTSAGAYKWGVNFRAIINSYIETDGNGAEPSGVIYDPDTGIYSLKVGWSTDAPVSAYISDMKFVALSLDATPGVALTEDSVKDIIITLDEEIEYATGEAWVSTGVRYEASRSEVSPLSGKKVLVMGDSISADEYGNYTKWVTVLKKEGFFPSDTVNSSQHATGFVARYTGEDENAQNDFIDRIAEVSDKGSYDLIIVFGGINDYIQNIEMGETGGDKDTYFKPAVDHFFDFLIKNFTQARIVVLTPLRTYNIWKNTAGGSQSTGHYQTEYAEYIREVAKSYCLPVLDLTEESGFCPFVEEFKNEWTLIPNGYSDADGVHPNADYQERFLAPMIKRFLTGLYGG